MKKTTYLLGQIVTALVLSLSITTPAFAALAHDSSVAVDGGINATGSYSTSFNNVGGNVLVVAVWTRYLSAFTLPTSVTYNGVALTYLTDTNDGAAGDFRDVSLWGLANPSTGANTLQVNLSGTSVRNALMAETLTGAAASPFGAVGSGSSAASVTSGSVSVTTTAANSVVVAAESDDGGTASTATGVNQTIRASVITAGGYSNSIGTQTTTSTGSYTSSWNFTASGPYAAPAVEIKALATASIFDFGKFFGF